jgi:hypothetical protein
MSDILFPPGRMIGGNLDKLFPRTEANGTPKIGKDGQPEMQCSIGYAIPKGTETHWSQTPWGSEIFKVGSAAHPNLVQSPSFSWKITDGDSQLPNKKGKRPCDQSAYPGNWVMWLSQGWLPKRVNANGTIELPEGSIVPGFYIQVFGSVAGNKLVPNGTPGVYLNPIAVALIGEGDRLTVDVDTTAVGFGTAQLPPGARPVTMAAPEFAQQPPIGALAPAGFASQQGQPAPGYPAGGVQPAPNFLQPSGAPVAPGVPTVPPAPPAGPQMTAKAAGAPYLAFIAQGWTDEMLRAQGYMV